MKNYLVVWKESDPVCALLLGSLLVLGVEESLVGLPRIRVLGCTRKRRVDLLCSLLHHHRSC